MQPEILTLLTFIAGALIVAAMYSFVSDVFFRDRSRVKRRIDDAFRKQQRDQIQTSGLFKKLRPIVVESDDEGFEAQPTRWQKFVAMVEQSGLHLSAERLVVYAVAAGAIGAAIFGLVSFKWYG